jgi:hypothetical protein
VRSHASKVSYVETSFLPTGVLGVGTNKGAVALAFCLRGVRLCIVNAHLAAHADKLLQRNRHVQDIIKHLRLGTSSLELPVQYHTIWAGDLNYRIDESRAEVLRLIDGEQWQALYELDQLSRELAAHRVLFGFRESRLGFPPTYKYARHAPAVARRRGLMKGLRNKHSFPRMHRGEGNTPSTKGSPAYETPNQMARTPPDGSPEAGSRRRVYEEEKQRVPSWCDRVLWRSLPGPHPLAATHTADCDDAAFWASDHAPVTSLFELEVPVLPEDLSLHHCTIYLSGLHLYRARPAPRTASGAEAAAATFSGPSLTARSSVGKGVPLPVAGNKLQNLPPQLTVYAHLLVLHKLMSEPPQFHAALSADGHGATNIVIGPMLVQREYLKLQQLQLRVSSLSGGKALELGQAAFSLAAAAHGRPTEFDVTVEHLTAPVGFNLRGTVSIVYTKTLGADAWMDTSRPASIHSFGGRGSREQSASCSRRQQSNFKNSASSSGWAIMGKASTIDEERGPQFTAT